MTNFFANVNTLDELKKAYKRAALQYHPDCGGDNATMAKINAEYEIRFEQLKKAHNATAPENKQTTEAPQEFINIINLLLKLDGLTVELCGCWLWISGNTKPHKDALKAAGCKWAPKKGMWSWHHAEDGSFYYRGKKSINEIRIKYGSEVYTTSGDAVPSLK